MLCYYESPMEINILFDKGYENSLESNWLQDMVTSVLVKQNIDEMTEMGLVITGQERIQELNKTYRGKDMPTDVLAFCMLPESLGAVESDFITPPDGMKHLGEVIISYPQAVKQAAEHRHSIRREFAILIIHGVLHLLGYDHAADEQAQEMEAMETAILEYIKGGLD